MKFSIKVLKIMVAVFLAINCSLAFGLPAFSTDFFKLIDFKDKVSWGII